MANIVEYILNMKDNLSPAIDGATSHVNKMEGALNNVKGIAMSIGAALGIGVGIYEIINFVKESGEAFELIEQATAKVEANLESTGQKAGISLKEIQGFAKGLSSHIQATQAEVTDMASQLLTFPSITKDVFQQSMGLVADIAKQTGHALSETGIMYGKALNDPIDGLQKMQRYGVIFSDQEKKRITQLQSGGHLILAQKAMMEAIAGSGYAGVAEKMFNADPMNRFNKMMERSKENVGELYKTVVDKFAPLMESLANSIGDSMDFEKIKAGLSEFTDKAIEVVKGIINFVKPLIEPIQRYIMAVWEGGKKIFASWGQFAGAGGGIFTWIRDRIGEIINAITYVYSAITSLIAGIIDVFHTIYVILDKLGIIWLIGKVFDTVWGLVKVIASGLAWIYENTIKPVVDAISWAYNKVKDLLGIKDVGIVATVKTTTETNSLIPGKEGKQGKAGSQAETPISTPATKAEGQKTINIHVAYNAPLITGFTISTVNLKEGLQNLKAMVSDILVSATHDSLMGADH